MAPRAAAAKSARPWTIASPGTEALLTLMLQLDGEDVLSYFLVLSNLTEIRMLVFGSRIFSCPRGDTGVEVAASVTVSGCRSLRLRSRLLVCTAPVQSTKL